MTADEVAAIEGAEGGGEDKENVLGGVGGKGLNKGVKRKSEGGGEISRKKRRSESEGAGGSEDEDDEEGEGDDDG